MENNMIPCFEGKPILSEKPQQAFRVAAEEIIYSIKQQFTEKELALREMGQNSQDAEASTIEVDYSFEDPHAIIEFKDDGCGMDRHIMIDKFLCIFDSPKEGQKEKVGNWALGRLSLLCYEPEKIEVITLSAGDSGFRLVIEKDLSGALYELDPDTARKAISNDHGTLVRMIIPVDSEQSFVGLVEKANQCMEKELAWIKPVVRVATVKMTDQGAMEYGQKKINRPMTVPGRYSTEWAIQMASGTGRVHCAIGLQSSENSGLAPNYPVQRRYSH